MTNEEITVASKKEAFIENIQSHTSALQAGSALLNQAKQVLNESDFPTTKVEYWKYTRTARIANESWQIKKNDSQIDITPYLIPGLDANLAVFVNGFYREDLSTKLSGKLTLTVGSPSEELPGLKFKHIFSALNAVYSTSVIQLYLPKKDIEEKPLHLLHIVTDEKALAQASIFIRSEESSSLQLVESFITTTKEKTFTNRLLYVHVGENAWVHLNKIQEEGDSSFLMNDDNVYVESNGNFTINTLTIDGGWIRNNLNIDLDGQNIEANLNGFYLPRNKQHIDNHTRVEHKKPHSHSNELYKGILNDKSTGVFNGMVYVHPDAQKTNAFQSNANILISDDAQVNSKPELEIYADDVKCSHGTTTGQMDEGALFYLKTRGIGDENALRLLAAAFINDVIDKVDNPPVKEYVISELVKRELLFV